MRIIQARMHWMSTIWAMAAGACFMLALPNLILWLARRDRRANLLFSLTAAGAGGVALSELSMMNAASAEAFAAASKLGIIPLALLLVSLFWFIVDYLGTRRWWLAWLLSAGWLLVLALNLASPYGIVFLELPRIEPLVFSWGESVTVADGVPHPLRWLPDLFSPLLLFLIADASIFAWQRGLRRRAVLVGGGAGLFISIAGLHSPLVDLDVIESPYLISLAFLGVVLAMGVELTFDAARAAELSDEVAANEKRWRTLLEEVQLLVLGVDASGHVDYANPYFTRLTGFASRDIVGKPVAALVSSDPEADEQSLQKKNGGELRIVWSRVAHENAGVLSIGSDVTEQRRAEAARDQATRNTEKALREIEALQQRLEEEVVYLKDEVKTTGGFDEIVGEHDALRYVLRKVEEVAPLNTTVLVEGETGVGKELFARAIHSHGSRGHRPLIKVNCASLPPNLIESELFGHEKGAFTGAARLRRGRFELADGGTLFLDEIGELPLELQGKLLRVLQEGEFERVGGDRTLSVDVRVIAATNRNLKQEVEAGAFREDLFYRLHVYPITVPPLRKRKSDIPLLVSALVKRYSHEQKAQPAEIGQPVIDELVSYDWPGNVRELENVIQRAVITSRGRKLKLAARLLPSSSTAEEAGSNGYRGTLDEVDRAYVRSVLELTSWRIEGEKGAAELLGLHPNTLRFRMRKLGLQRPKASTST